MMTNTRRHQLKKIMLNAWKLFKRAGNRKQYNFGYWLRISWLLFKKLIQIDHSKVVGVSFYNSNGQSRQELLHRLDGYKHNEVRLTAVREPKNIYDSNAIRIDAQTLHNDTYSKTVTIGYVNKLLAKTLSPLVDNNITLILFFTGINRHPNKPLIGCSFSYLLS